MQKIKCRRCGGNKERRQKCKLCELLASGDIGEGMQKPSTWPMKSTAMAVGRKQVKEATERAKRHGVATFYDDTGKPVLTSPGHRRALMKLHNYSDNDGFC